MTKLYENFESTAEEIIRNELLEAGAKAETVKTFAHAEATELCYQFKSEVKKLTQQFKDHGLF